MSYNVGRIRCVNLQVRSTEMAYCTTHDCYFGVGHDLGIDIDREAILEKCPQCAAESESNDDSDDSHYGSDYGDSD